MIVNISLSRIQDNPWQTRKQYNPERIEELAQDIKRNGLLHPPNGRLVLNGRVVNPLHYGGVLSALEDNPSALVQLGIGHNRKRAFDLLSQADEQYATLPMQIGQFDDEAMARMAWSENHQRRDLTPMEEAWAIQQAMKDFNWTQERAGEEFGLSRSTVANKLRLLQLPNDVQQRLQVGDISERQAYALLPLFQLPEPARAAAAKFENSWVYSPSKIVELAVRGDSSDSIRNRVDSTIDAATTDLDKAPFPLDYDFGKGSHEQRVRTAACTNCALLVKRSDKLRCGDPECFHLKRELYQDTCLSQAEEKTGYQRLPDDILYYDTETFGYGWLDAGKEIIAEGCPRNQLHLRFSTGLSNINSIQPEGTNGVQIVCARGNGKPCYCLQKWKRENEDKTVSPRDLEEKQIKDRYQTYVQKPAQAALAEELRAMKPEAWELALKRAFEYEFKPGFDWQKVCKVIAEKALGGANGYYWGNWGDIEQCREKVNGILNGTAAVTWPDLMPTDKVEAIRHRFKKLKDFVEGRQLTPEQIRGNITNLDTMRNAFLALPVGESDEELFTAITLKLRELEEIESEGTLMKVLADDAAACAACDDQFEEGDGVSCSCGVVVCEDCYSEHGHMAHDTNPDNAWMKELEHEN